MKIVELNYEELKQLEESLESYDSQFLPTQNSEIFQLGIKNDKQQVIAGLFATCTAFHIVYVSMLFVDSQYRRQGLGKSLLDELERQARLKNLKLIRLDTFDYQGRDFYKAIGYEEVGSYYDENQNFSEHFFLKRLTN